MKLDVNAVVWCLLFVRQVDRALYWLAANDVLHARTRSRRISGRAREGLPEKNSCDT